MSNVLKALETELRPGYRVVRASGKKDAWQVIDREGKIVRSPDNRPLIVGGSDACWDSVGQMRRTLKHTGVLRGPRKRRAVEQHAPHTVPPPKAAANPILLAQEILRDPAASPRERSMARSFLEQLEKNEMLRDLGKRLASRVREYAS